MDDEKFQNLAFSEFTLEPSRRVLRRNDKIVSLNAKAFDLLHFLALNPGRLISKEDILDAVWKDQFVEESNLTVQISTVRKALGDLVSNPRFFATIPGKGYQFVADVSRIDGDGLKVTDTQPTTYSDSHEHEPAASIPVQQDQKRRRVYFAIAFLALLFVGLFFALRGLPIFDKPIRSLAVLPFTNDAESLSPEILADGLAESVIFSLSRLPELRVLSRESSFRFRDPVPDIQLIGRELGVAAVLTGRIKRLENVIVVRAQLVSTHDDSVIWGGHFSRKDNDLELLQIDIAQEIARQLKITLAKPDQKILIRAQTVDHEAFQIYLAGRHHMNRLTDDGFKKARESFQMAVVKDPDYALAHAGIAESYNLLSGWGAMAPNDGFPLAKAASIRALELDEELAEAHVQLGIVRQFYDLDWPGAEAAFARSIELNPSLAEAHHMYGYLQSCQGRFEEARRHMDRATELNPLSLLLIVGRGDTYVHERRFPEAEAAYRKALEMDPNSGLAHWALGNALLFDNRTEEAISEFETAIGLTGDSPDEPASLAYAYAIAGRTKDARKLLAELELRAKTEYISPAILAVINIGLGDLDRAYFYLESAERSRDAIIPFLKVDPYFDRLRPDPRFDQVLRRAGLSD